MDQQVCDERRDAFIFAKKIANAGKHNFAAANFIDGDERLIRWRDNKGLGTFQFNLIETENSAMQILWRLMRSQTTGVMCFTSLAGEANTEKITRQPFHLRGIQHNCSAAAHIFLQLAGPFFCPGNVAACDDRSIFVDCIFVRVGADQHIKDISEDAGHKCLSFTTRRLAFANWSKIVGRAEQLAQRAVAAIDLRNLERPLRIISHFPAMRRIKQESYRCVRLAAIGMLPGKAHELVRDAPERIQLKRMFAWSRLEKLIEALLEINRRRARHVIKVVTLAIP